MPQNRNVTCVRSPRTSILAKFLRACWIGHVVAVTKGLAKRLQEGTACLGSHYKGTVVAVGKAW